MAVAFVSSTADIKHSNSDTTFTIDAPASIVSGNVLIAIIYNAVSTSVTSWVGPTGWTKQNSYDGSGAVAAIFWKIATNSEPTTYTFTQNSTGGTLRFSGAVLQYSGVDSTTPIETSTITPGIFSASPSAPTLTLTGTADGLISAFCTRGETVTTAPSGETLLAHAIDSGLSNIDVYGQVLSASGSTPSESVTWAAIDITVAISIALTPGVTAVNANVTGVAGAGTVTGVAGTVAAERDATVTGVAAAATVTGVAGSLTKSASVVGVAAAVSVTGAAAGISGSTVLRWGADANVLGWQKADIGGTGTTGASLASIRTYLIDTYLPDGLGPYGKFFDGGSGWHTAYTNYHNSGYGAAANERHPVICAKTHTTATFNTLMTDMAAALPAGEVWYACFFSEPEDDFNAGTLTHANYQAAWASMNTLRNAHPNGDQVLFIPILMAYQEISGSSHWSDFLTPVLAVADVIGWDVYDDNGDPQSWSFEDDIYPAIQALQTASGLPWSIPEYGLQVSTHSGSTDDAAGVLSRWEAMVAVCEADPDFRWGNYWMDGPHAANQRSAVIRTDTASAAYLAFLVETGVPLSGGGTPTITIPLSWSANVAQVVGSQPDSGTDIGLGNLDGHRLHFSWSAVAEVVTDIVDPLDERHPPLERASFVMDSPTIDPDTGYPDDTWTHTLNRSLWGRLHLAINGRSRTLNRGFAFVPLNDADTEPFGDAEASFRLPGITEYDDTEAAPWHIKPLSKVRFFRRDMDGNDHTLYEGDVASVEPDGIQSEDGPPGIVVQCVGVLYRLDLLESTPPLNVLRRDYGGIIAGQINTKRESHALGIGAMHQPNTGINGVRSPDFSKLITGAVQDYLSNMIDDDGNQWTLKVVRPRTPKLVLKDTTTVDATVTYGTPGISVNLSKDYTAATTAVYGSGASGHSQWMGATFPNLTQGDRPTFPLGVGESFSPGDGQPGFAPLAAYLRRGAYGNVQSDDTYLAVDADNVKAFQDDAGLTESGVVSAQTWEAAFASGANSGTVQGASVRAIFSRSGTRKHVHNAQGAVTGRNDSFDPTVPRIEEYVPFGDGVTKALATRSAKQIVNRAYPAGHSGEIVLTADPEEMSRYDLRSGMNIKVKHYKGDHVLLHITRRERDWTTGTVTLTVDEKGNDELTAAAIHQRDRDTSDLTRRHTHGKRKSRVFNDYGQWLSEDGAGEIPLMYQQAGLWNVQKIPASPSGSLERVFLAAGTGLTEHLLNRALNAETPNDIPGAARSCILITGQPIHPRALNRMEGMSTPLLNLPDGTSPWDKNHSVLRRKFEMIFAAGGPGQALGFFPHDDPGDGTDVNLSGLFEDGGSWQYGPTEHFWIWVALWSPVSCKIGGRIYPGAPQ